MQGCVIVKTSYRTLNKEESARAQVSSTWMPWVWALGLLISASGAAQAVSFSLAQSATPQPHPSPQGGSVAQDGPGGRERTGMERLEELYSSRLEALPDGVYHYQQASEYFLVSSSVAERSAEHLRAACDEMNFSELYSRDVLEGLHKRAEKMDYRFSGPEDMVADEVWPYSHRLLIDWPYYSVRSTGMGGSANIRNTNIITVDSIGRSFAQFNASGEVLFQGRSQDMGLFEGAGGIIAPLIELRLRLRALLDHGWVKSDVVQESVDLAAIEFAPTHDLLVAFQMPPVGPSRYFMVPGSARITLESSGDSVVLELIWRDTLGSLMERDFLVWQEGCALPSILVEKFALGTEFLLSRNRGEVSQDLSRIALEKDFRWEPMSNKPITDARFGARLTYIHSASAAAPLDKNLIARVDGQIACAAMRAAKPVPVARQLDVGEGTKRVALLGSFPLGSEVNFLLQLENTAPDSLYSASVSAVCGYFALSSLGGQLDPGRSRELSGTFLVTAAGLSQKTIKITWQTGDGPVVDHLELQAEGSQGILNTTDFLYLGQCSADGGELSCELPVGTDFLQGKAQDIQLAVQGDLSITESSVNADQAFPGRHWLRFGAGPVDGLTWGSLEGRLLLTESGADTACKPTLLLADVVPPCVEEDLWPATRHVYKAEEWRMGSSISLPVDSIEALTVESGEQHLAEQSWVRGETAGQVLKLKWNPAGNSTEPRRVVLRVGVTCCDSQGSVRLVLILL